jgi:AmiR/NasT family two-component response regulator
LTHAGTPDFGVNWHDSRILQSTNLEMNTNGTRSPSLRVLVANERQDRLANVAAIVAGLGHEVLAPQIDVAEVGMVTAREQPDVALVGLGNSSAHALRLIEEIVDEASCPVVVLLHAPDPEFVVEAAKRGVFAHITDGEPQEWQNSIEIVLRRFAEYQDLENAFARRATIERAKGILMERHSVDENGAFELLRDHSRRGRHKLVDIALAVVNGHLLLPASRGD